MIIPQFDHDPLQNTNHQSLRHITYSIIRSTINFLASILVHLFC